MTNPASPKSGRNGAGGRIFFLDVAGSRVLSANPDGSDLKTIVVEKSKEVPDGLAVGLAPGHLYWTHMGDSTADDGAVLPSGLDCRDPAAIAPQGATIT